ncbi:MAG: YciI family protein [Cyclobacteriaceae bacterium]
MKEFMLFIYTVGDHMAEMSPEKQQKHVQKVGAYIQGLVDEGTMKSAQPLELEGITITGHNGEFQDGPFNESKEVIGGYYHMVAKSIDEVVAIIKKDPRFEDNPWKIEIRPIMQVAGIN